MKVIVEVRVTTAIEMEVDDKYKALVNDADDMTWQDVNDLLDQAFEEANNQLTGVVEIEAVKTLKGKILA